jgi:hypothetical protein
MVDTIPASVTTTENVTVAVPGTSRGMTRFERIVLRIADAKARPSE